MNENEVGLGSAQEASERSAQTPEDIGEAISGNRSDVNLITEGSEESSDNSPSLLPIADALRARRQNVPPEREAVIDRIMCRLGYDSLLRFGEISIYEYERIRKEVEWNTPWPHLKF